MKKFIDMFCGAGGWTTALIEVCKELGIPHHVHGINHWGPAINTNRANHPGASFTCDKLNLKDPADFGQLAGLIASPECTHFSVALGGKPRKDQKRLPAALVPRWVAETRPAFFAIENVREFEKWGELDADGKRVPGTEGNNFRKLVIKPLRALGYSVEYRVLNCADYGDPTSRQRLFILGRRDGKAIEWPTPTHSQSGAGGLKPWVPARDVIDWNLPSQSIFTRKKPLCKNTLRRIEVGIQKFWGEWGKPFLAVLRGQSTAVTVDAPLPTLTTGQHLALVEPLLVSQKGTSQAHLDGTARPVNRPAPTIHAGGTHLGLLEPFLTQNEHGGREHALNKPMHTVTGNSRADALVEPFLLPQQQGWDKQNVQPIGKPLPTLTATGAEALVEPFLTCYHGGPDAADRVLSTDKPLPTVDCSNRYGMCAPFVVSYYGNSDCITGTDQPLPTVTCRDRFGLVQQFGLDIKYRMLQPHELAAAMGFPRSYMFYGNKTQVVRQIGNAVPVNTARALLRALILQTMEVQVAV